MKIIQHLDDFKLLRFLDLNGLIHTLGIQHECKQPTDLNATFLLRSLNHYKQREDHRADKYENQIISNIEVNGETKTLENNLINTALVSCWSTYRKEDLESATTWQTFPDAIAAIETTIGDIKYIFDQIAPIHSQVQYLKTNEKWGILHSDFMDHGEVIYYPIANNPYKDSQKNCFYKRNDYAKEKEYRFAAIFGPHSFFSPELFCVKLKNTHYIKKIYFKEGVFSQDAFSQIRTRIKAFYRLVLDIPSSNYTLETTN